MLQNKRNANNPKKIPVKSYSNRACVWLKPLNPVFLSVNGAWPSEKNFNPAHSEFHWDLNPVFSVCSGNALYAVLKYVMI